MLPSTVTFAAGDRTYIASLNALIADMNALYTSFLATTAGAFFKATSTTSATIGTGSKGPFTLVETSERAFALGMPVRVADSAAPQTNYMDGSIAAYNTTTRELTVQVASIAGSGTKTAWTISMTAVSGIVPVASGGTGASDAATARTNLGLGSAATSASSAFATAAQGTTADNALPKAGGTMTGNVAHGNNNVTGVKVLSFNGEYDCGNSGTALTIDFANGSNQKVTLTGNATLTITTPSAPGHYQLRLIQDGTGGRSVTWAGSAYASTRWGGSASAPAINTTAAGSSVVNFWFDGTNLYQTLFRIGMA
jgi:hypothetical protein